MAEALHISPGADPEIFAGGSALDVIFLQTLLYDFPFQFNTLRCNPNLQPEFFWRKGA